MELKFKLSYKDLDKVFKYLYEHQDQSFGAYHLDKNVFGNPPSLERIGLLLKKLSDENFIKDDDILFIKVESKDRPFRAYCISFDGVLFYEASLIKGRPFYSRLINQRLKKTYSIFKIIASGITTVVIIWISWLTYQSQDNTRDNIKSESIIDSLNNRIKSQTILIDSLTINSKTHIDLQDTTNIKKERK